MELQKPWPSVVLAWESSCFSSLPYLLPVSKVGIKKKLENSCVYYFIFFVTFTLLQTMAKYPLYIWHKMKTWNVEWKGSASVIEKITAQPPPKKNSPKELWLCGFGANMGQIPGVLPEVSAEKCLASLPEPSWKAGHLMNSYLIKLRWNRGQEEDGSSE